MAIVKFGGGVVGMRGSIGGTCYSRCAAGNTARARTKCVNPRSSGQRDRRTAVAYIAKYWSNTLTEQQRTDWRAYAEATTWTNKLGETIEINGLAAFMRVNTLQRLIPSALIANAPTAVGHAGGVTWDFDAEWDTGKIQLDEPTGAFDKDIDIMTMWFFQGIPAEPGRISIPKGFTYIGRIWGSSGSPLSFPYELSSAYTMRLGQLITLKAMFQDEHYRISGPSYVSVLATPS